jgi:hypothetical protein
MGSPDDLPRHLCPIRDAAVAHAITGAPLPKHIESLMSWFEINGNYEHEFLILDLKKVAYLYFDDIEAKAREGNFLEDAVLTDNNRVDVARAIIEKEICDGDAGFVIGFDMVRDDGASAIFFCETRSGGQGGNIYSFAGVFETAENCKDHFLRSGVLVEPASADIPSGEILKLWRHQKPKSQNKRRKSSAPK